MRNLAWQIETPLDIEKMKEASKYLIGTHDFTSFRTTKCQAKSPIKSIDYIKIDQINDEVHFYISAKSFLHHMVRNIIGTLTLVGMNKWKIIDIKNCLDIKDRSKAGITAPACGLYFLKVDY